MVVPQQQHQLAGCTNYVRRSKPFRSLTSIGRRWWKWAGDGRGLLRHASSASFSSQCVTDLCQPLLELVPSLGPVV